MEYNQNTTQQPVTVVVSHLVQPGKTEEFEAWLRGVSAEAKHFPGHLGVNIIRPAGEVQPEYGIIVKFDSYHNLRNWEQSDSRTRWAQKLEPLIQRPPRVERLTGLEYWFTPPEQPIRTPPRRKTVLLTWLGLFPLVLLVPPLLERLLSGYLPHIIVAAIITFVMVSLMAYLVMPAMTRVFRFWLFGRNG